MTFFCRHTLAFLCCLLVGVPIVCWAEALPESPKPAGYTAVVFSEDGFLAVGSDGRLDEISPLGKVTRSEVMPNEKLLCLYTEGSLLLVGGEKGSLWLGSISRTSLASDTASTPLTHLQKAATGTDAPIRSLTVFNNVLFAGLDNGQLLIGDSKGSFHTQQLALKGSIVSLSARNADCFGVTDQGEIIRTADGINWTVVDFNEFYQGYYKSCRFTCVLATENRIAISGKNTDGTPALLFSSEGNVWTDRTLSYTDDQGTSALLEAIPNSLYYDPTLDQFVLACSQGKMMIIPSCSHCNKYIEVSTHTLTGVAGNESTVLFVGEGFEAVSLNGFN